MINRLLAIIFYISFIPFCQAHNGFYLKGTVSDAHSKEPLPYASVQLFNETGLCRGGMVNGSGGYHLSNIAAGRYTLKVTYIGFEPYSLPLELRSDSVVNIALRSTSTSLNEVVITARESKGFSSSSLIDRHAMSHLQPTSFSDLLELLPGGRSADPDMSKVNRIKLREAGMPSYNISSVGVRFIMDGMPLNREANLQKVHGSSYGAAKEMNGGGVDMRTLSTDNIDNVEVVRGIPSVEYGDLTGGLVKIERLWRPVPFSVRLKADPVSKLYSAGKGFQLSPAWLLNTDLGYLDSKVDPRDQQENYKRMTFSARLSHRVQRKAGLFKLMLSGDFTGSFDDMKRNKDGSSSEDRYRSGYQRWAAAGRVEYVPSQPTFFRGVKGQFSLDWSKEEIREQKGVYLDRPYAVSGSSETGEHEGVFLPAHYLTKVRVDGRPLYLYGELKADFGYRMGSHIQRIKVGAAWNFSKNYGKGELSDLSRPINVANFGRPRPFSEVPSRQDVTLYAEHLASISVGRHRILLSAGVRTSALAGLPARYRMSGKLYADPRINAVWTLPSSGLLRKWHIELAGGVGWMSKMPSTSQLFPENLYGDYDMLNYYHPNPNYRRVRIFTDRWENVNYDISPARNRKFELRASVARGDHRFSITCFDEKMENGLNMLSYFRTASFRKYHPSFENGQAGAIEDWEQLPSSAVSLVDVYSKPGNNLEVKKRGIEWVYNSPRFRFLHTRLTFSGAWIKTLYREKLPSYKASSIVMNGERLRYVGVYDWKEGDRRQQLTTNMMVDSYLRRLDLAFSLGLQCTWFSSRTPLWNSGMPVSYVDAEGRLHPFEEKDAADVQLQHLVYQRSDLFFEKQTEPFMGSFNLKATKGIGKWMKIALFVNRIFTIEPEYRSGNVWVRRSSSPYFGMEANLKF